MSERTFTTWNCCRIPLRNKKDRRMLGNNLPWVLSAWSSCYQGGNPYRGWQFKKFESIFKQQVRWLQLLTVVWNTLVRPWFSRKNLFFHVSVWRDVQCNFSCLMLFFAGLCWVCCLYFFLFLGKNEPEVFVTKLSSPEFKSKGRKLHKKCSWIPWGYQMFSSFVFSTFFDF